tara:strand:+ start:849 stop:2156 length:1308 start_codon:yes stop_codon:yes gene_type:complete
MDLAIKLENVYKEYRLGVIGHGTLYKDLQSFYAKVRGIEDPNSLIGSSEEVEKKNILAVNNVSLSIEQGDVLGIIGLNGAGKSTLLKLLSRVTAPTKGIIKYNGRISSLLEVGTGFHPELTGRENIFLNGAINGMSSREVDSKLDEIVAFAGVEKFIDTPVKRYSSGMYVRLAFAVAAHLEPDILVVDEVLAVGDLSFQRKAIGKMKEVSKQRGRTVLFVSHNMESIQKLCNKTILLDSGSIAYEGETSLAIDRYKSSQEENVKKFSGRREWTLEQSSGNDIVRCTSIMTTDNKGKICSEFNVTDEINLVFDFHVLKEDYQLSIAFEIESNGKSVLIGLDDYVENSWGNQDPLDKGLYRKTCTLPANYFGEDTFSINLRIYNPPAAANTSAQVQLLRALYFKVIDTMELQGSRGTYPYDLGAVMRPKLRWVSKKV